MPVQMGGSHLGTFSKNCQNGVFLHFVFLEWHPPGDTMQMHTILNGDNQIKVKIHILKCTIIKKIQNNIF